MGKEENTTLQSVQGQVMQIKIGDIVNTFVQTQKIIKDVSGLQTTVKEQLQRITK